MSSGSQPDGDASARERPQARDLYQGDCHGTEIGHCVILHRLGHGSEGMVFKARHRRLGSVVALKVLPGSVAQDPISTTRLRREIEAIARLKHPNIVAALEVDDDRGIPFLVMEYVEGRDLGRLVRDRGPLPVGEAIDLLIQATRGLEAAHSQGIVHHNIKPSNLMLGSDGVVRVLDLGVARIVGASSQSALDDGGRPSACGMRGTVDYRAPELDEGSTRADHRADIYSLACTLYYLMTGRESFPGDTEQQRLMAHQQQKAPSLRAQRPDAPSALEHAFQKMMAKHPADRPESMTAVVALLEACKVTAVESSATAAEATKSSPSTKVPGEHAIKWTAPSTSARESSIFIPRDDSDESRTGVELNLDELVGDVRSEVPLPTLTAPTNPRTGKSKTTLPKWPVPPRSQPARWDGRPVILLAMVALVVLGAAFLRFVVFSEPWASDLNQKTSAATDARSVLTDTRSGPRNIEPHSILQPQETVRTIFDGKTGKAWMLTNKRPLPPDRVQPDGLNPHGTGSYLVVYDKKVGDFVLEFEYKLTKGGKSGVFLRIGDLSDPVNSSIEVALDDTTGTSATDSGAFYDLVAPNENVQKPADQWNQMTITAAGPVLSVSLNGKDVSRINLDEWTVRGKRPDGTGHQFQQRPIVDLPRRGYLGLQDHGSDCWFRNITLKTSGSPSAQ